MPKKNLTEMTVQKLKPTDKQAEYYDQNFNPGVSGSFGLRISPGGKKTWFISYRLKDDSRQVKQKFNVGCHPSMNLKTARKEASMLLADIDAGGNPREAKQARRREPTFEDITNVYLEYHAKRHKRPNSIKEDTRIIDNELVPVWGKWKAKSIKRSDAISLLDKITLRGPVMANRVAALLSTIFNVAIDRELLETNPCYRIRRPGGKEKPRERVLNPTELKAVWKAFKAIRHPMNEIFKIRLLTAQRGGEVISMRWEDINFDEAVWTIPETVTKNKKSHRVPLTKPVLEILNSLVKKNKWVFPSRVARTATGHMSNIQKGFDLLKEKSKVSDFVLHDLRRTAASMMAEMGISEFDIGEVLNHTNENITAVYNRHSYDPEKRRALDRWAQRLKQVITGEKSKIITLSK